MKKFIYTFAVVSLLSLSISPVLAQTETVCGEGETLIDGFCHPPFQVEEISTTMDESTPGGSAPIIMAKWEMNAETQGDDDKHFSEGAQFTPPGEWGEYKDIEICAVATDPDGIPGPAGEALKVYADVYFPEGRALGRCHVAEDGGCGLPHGYELQLTHVLPKLDGYNLLCNGIRNNNSKLPVFYGYEWDQICNRDTGALMKDTALVYCKGTSLKWEDPAGDYHVKIHAVDKAGAKSVVQDNYFQYMPLTAFEVDFSNVNYGTVKIDTAKFISGDLYFDEQGNSDKPTVRNVGNTRLQMKVKQDDMGLGKTENGSEEWNVKYDARVGSNATPRIYEPYNWAYLDDYLGLSCTDEMDFSIRISKFPEDQRWSGDMWLGAVFAPFLTCEK